VKQYSIATHIADDGKTEGLTVEGSYIEVIDNVLTVYKEHGGGKGREAVASFRTWMHVFETEAAAKPKGPVFEPTVTVTSPPPPYPPGVRSPVAGPYGHPHYDR